MKSGTDYSQEYGQAQQAYLQGNYQEAASIIDDMAVEYPEEPSILLLRGHIYCYGLQQYEFAKKQYESVLQLTDEPELINYANNGIEQAQQFEASSGVDDYDPEDTAVMSNNQDWDMDAQEDWNNSQNEDEQDWGGNEDFGYSNGVENPFGVSEQQNGAGNLGYNDDSSNPFGGGVIETEEDWEENEDEDFVFPENLNLGDLEEEEENFHNFAQDEEEEEEKTFVVSSKSSFNQPLNNSEYFNSQEGIDINQNNDGFDDFQEEIESNSFLGVSPDGVEVDYQTDFEADEEVSETLLMNASPSKEGYQNDYSYYSEDNYQDNSVSRGLEMEESFSLEDLDIEETSASLNKEAYEESMDGLDNDLDVSNGFLEEFDVFNEDDLDSIPNFDMGNVDEELANSGFFNQAGEVLTTQLGSNLDNSVIEDSLFSIGEDDASTPTSFSPTSESVIETKVEVEQGFLSAFENSPLRKKQWLTAAAAGITSALAVAVVSFTSANMAAKDGKPEVISHLRNTSTLMTLIAGVAGFGSTVFLGGITANQIKRSTNDLQAQFEAVCQGNLNVKATVYAEDEFGQLAASFNQMAKVILTTTSEAQRRAEETEQAREDLQRQVIRLLDDVEGAARGDLTVQAEVTADVLGAVADAFNLTIQNLRQIVQQVKRMARQVNQNSTDSESFARSLSADAWRQAEELAVTLNSVQMMTEAIKRVADNSREAEVVARTAAETAFKGGESVESTVAGILQIRETVSETARKVKRLAEASQEISKIVAVISTIASRTNLLALNASIEAARAGEAGRGFAIVADEVRQLADRSAKALKEIEQIVMQIQGETSGVMTAMEEGIQQVIEGMKRAEQAKRSLEDIIDVSNRMDTLVRSISADTVEQRENAHTVTQVMQSVELTAQETSQESQRVAGSLQTLVTIAKDLISSVERFRVESSD
jgi:twitching motility protein PilJ